MRKNKQNQDWRWKNNVGKNEKTLSILMLSLFFSVLSLFSAFQLLFIPCGSWQTTSIVLVKLWRRRTYYCLRFILISTSMTSKENTAITAPNRCSVDLMVCRRFILFSSPDDALKRSESWTTHKSCCALIVYLYFKIYFDTYSSSSSSMTI